VWRFQMEVKEPGTERIDHGAELAFLFRNLPLAAEVDGAHPFLPGYWANFVRSGNPNGAGLPAWPEYGKLASYAAFTRTGVQGHQGLRQDICRLIQRP